MHFTRETAIVLDMLTACACDPGQALSLSELTERTGNGAQAIRGLLLLQQKGLLRQEPGERFILTLDPGSITLGSILRFTQPDLVRTEKSNAASPQQSVFTMAVEAALANFLKIADQFTVADLVAERCTQKSRAA